MNSLAIMNPESGSSVPIGWAESGLVPDVLVRAGIRGLCRRRLVEIHADDAAQSAADLNDFVAMMSASPVALVPELANEQHYEVPAQFYELVLGAHRKYSSCFWGEGTRDLDEAEASALTQTCERAGIVDGQDVLDLGCGWGSLSLWIATHYPLCSVTSVSNSTSQRRHIEAEAKRRGLNNIKVITCDMNCFEAPGHYDRVVSVEMFEHMRNYAELYRRISQWLKPDGLFFMHIFCHHDCAYEFVDQGPSDWMSRHFFSGGIMPAACLPLRFQQHLQLRNQWQWDGRHYQQTANAWLRNLDRNKQQVTGLFEQVYGRRDARRWVNRWRIFFMACAELFGSQNGQQWLVGHYLFARQADGRN